MSRVPWYRAANDVMKRFEIGPYPVGKGGQAQGLVVYHRQSCYRSLVGSPAKYAALQPDDSERVLDLMGDCPGSLP